MSVKSRFERILVAVDGSENSFKACEVVADLASKFKAEVTVLYVILKLPSGLSRSISAPRLAEEIGSQLEYEAKKPLEVATSLIKGGEGVARVKKQILHTRASIVQAIVEYAGENKTDLIVLGTRGHGGFRRMLLGSVSSGVATHARCPVLVVRSDSRKDRPQLRHILVAVDGSEYASRATKVAAEIAKTVGADLTVLNVMYIPYYAYSWGVESTIRTIEKAARVEGEKYLSAAASLAKEEGMMEVKQDLVLDEMQSPSRRIVEYAEKNGVDLIVVGTRGVGGFKRLLLGSVASGVLGYARCSVLVVTPASVITLKK